MVHFLSFENLHVCDRNVPAVQLMYCYTPALIDLHVLQWNPMRTHFIRRKYLEWFLFLRRWSFSRLFFRKQKMLSANSIRFLLQHRTAQRGFFVFVYVFLSCFRKQKTKGLNFEITEYYFFCLKKKHFFLRIPWGFKTLLLWIISQSCLKSVASAVNRNWTVILFKINVAPPW